MFFRQLRLLLWKNFTIRIRHPIRSFVEIVWPILLFSILIIIRKKVLPVNYAECHYPARALPSAGVFPWVETLFCNLDNPCFNEPVASESPGQVNDNVEARGLLGMAKIILDALENETTLLQKDSTTAAHELRLVIHLVQEVTRPDSKIKITVSKLYPNQATTEQSLRNLGLSNELIQTLMMSQLTFSQGVVFAGNNDKTQLLCNETQLTSAIDIPSSAPLNYNETSHQLCAFNSTQLNSMFAILTSQADLQNYVLRDYQNLLNADNIGVNPTDLLILYSSITKYSEDFPVFVRAVTSSITAFLGNETNVLTAIIGYDLMSEEGFAEFCGHPSPKSRFGTLVIGGIFSALSALQNTPEEDFCQKFVELFDKNDDFRFVWNVLKPVLLGKIPFSPDTNVTRMIMNRANVSFSAIAQMEIISKEWKTYGPQIYNYVENNPAVEALRIILDSGSATTLFNISQSNAEALKTFLSNTGSTTAITWKSVFSQADTSIRLIIKFLGCINLDKFEGHQDENTLVQRSLDLIDNNTFWAGIVFLSPTADDKTLPEHVSYKIRQDVDDVMRTDFIRDYVWAPGIATTVTQTRYLVNGFPDIQDMIEHGISDAATGNGGSASPSLGLITALPKIGYYLQSVPYPCYTSDTYWDPGPNANYSSYAFLYYTGGFLFIQDMLEQGIRSAEVSPDYAPLYYQLGAYLQEFPYPCYLDDEFLQYLGSMLSILMTLAYIYSVCIIIRNIVYEKERRLKEFMKMMGLSNGVHWVAWFINSFYMMTISSLLLAIVLRFGLILSYSNFFIIFLWLLCFCIATIAQCFLISCFFSKANLAAACGGIIYFMLYLPYNFALTWDRVLSFGGKIGLSLFSTVAFGYGANFIANYEKSGEGIQFYNWDKNPVPGDDFNFLISMMMMLVDAVIYFLIAWYVENVFPGRYGIPRPPYFMFTTSYWFGTATTSSAKGGLENLAYLDNSNAIKGEGLLEPEPTHLPLGVSIQNLTKIYKGTKVAVDNLSLNFYEGQITSFLGHNGAGKTTTMSILSGLFTQTSGTAYIHGKDIRTDIDSIRTSLGMCPQHNILFHDLTVKEHLMFFGGLHGIPSKELDAYTERMLAEVNLVDKRNVIVRNLSGGMKRKLSVAIAFVGDSKTVILDEPTAGVDPYARRGIWDILLKYRIGRTILLSTHHMDEADLLGDRIAIISQGSLKCCGSSLFLKSMYGVGYYLTVVKQKNFQKKEKHVITLPVDAEPELPEKLDLIDDEGFESNPSSSKASSVVSGFLANGVHLSNQSSLSTSALTLKQAQILVTDILPDAKLYEESSSEITFILPYSGIQDSKYVQLFKVLDENNLTYGLTDTSLEEIFLSVAEHIEEEKSTNNTTCCNFLKRRHRHHSIIEPSSELSQNRNVKQHGQVELKKVTRLSSRDESFRKMDVLETPENGVSPLTPSDSSQNTFTDGDDLNGKGSYQITGKSLVLKQFVALLIKRWHHARRNRKGIFAQVVLPSIFVLTALLLTLLLPPDGQPPLELQPWLYGDNQYIYLSSDNSSLSESVAVNNALLNNPGIGTRCMKNYQITNFDDKLLRCVPSDDVWNTNNDTKSRSQYIDSNENVTCQCFDGNTRILLAVCDKGAGGEPTPERVTDTTDILFNMTDRDTSDWLVKTTDRFIEKRYGGVSVGDTYHASVQQINYLKLIDLLKEFDSSFSRRNISLLLESMWRTENGKVWFNNNGWHAMPAWLNVLSNGVFRSKLGVGQDPTNYGISVYNHPLNFTKHQIDQAALKQTATDTAIAIVVVFAMSFIPASFVIFLIDERATKAKHLQFISGVNQLIYWVANFIWDMINYAVPAIIVIFIFLAFQTQAYVSAQNFPALVLLLLLYGWSITPMMYPFSFVFQVSSTAYVVLTCINLFIGVNTSITTFILEFIDSNEDLTRVNNILKNVFLIFPQFCLGRGLIDMSVNQAYGDAYARFGVDNYIDPLSWEVTGKSLTAMAIEGLVFFCFNLLIQYRFFVRPRVTTISPTLQSTLPTEDDVATEKTRILDGDPCESQDILRISNLSKVYKKMPLGKSLLAVDRMCVGVAPGECFGLLGVNGAGKTTTFKMLTGDEDLTAGDATVCGMSIRKDIRSVQQNMGYCPQFDALNSHLTGFEHLQMYARLRGIPSEEVDRVAHWAIAKMGLQQYADRPAGTYSGGNKRKLSAAIAFIGCPPVIFLDEPTAGMDPKSKRFLWERITDVVKIGNYSTGNNQRCVVLTSHSMEECEALCTRLAIMVNGRFMCLGTQQHLKNKYGKGYTVTVRVGGTCPDIEGVLQSLLMELPGAALKEKHHNQIVLQLPLNVARLAEVFQLLESKKPVLGIEDYSISQTTLDEVFVNFAKYQTDGMEEAVAVHLSEEVPMSTISIDKSV